jgi:hypothetical protein
MEGKKEFIPSFKKLERNRTSESKYLSFLFVFFLLQISRDLHPKINAFESFLNRDIFRLDISPSNDLTGAEKKSIKRGEKWREKRKK